MPSLVRPAWRTSFAVGSTAPSHPSANVSLQGVYPHTHHMLLCFPVESVISAGQAAPSHPSLGGRGGCDTRVGYYACWLSHFHVAGNSHCITLRTARA
jgi:hypothetical protein